MRVGGKGWGTTGVDHGREPDHIHAWSVCRVILSMRKSNKASPKIQNPKQEVKRVMRTKKANIFQPSKFFPCRENQNRSSE